MDVLFLTGFAPIVRDVAASHAFYKDALGLAFEDGPDNYVFTDKLDGIKHLGLWPLELAAESCFGTKTWPDDVPVPQATVEFEVRDVAAAAAELEAKGCRLVHETRTEPWGQVIARLLSPEGLLVGVCYTPWYHEDE